MRDHGALLGAEFANDRFRAGDLGDPLLNCLPHGSELAFQIDNSSLGDGGPLTRPCALG